VPSRGNAIGEQLPLAGGLTLRLQGHGLLLLGVGNQLGDVENSNDSATRHSIPDLHVKRSHHARSWRREQYGSAGARRQPPPELEGLNNRIPDDVSQPDGDADGRFSCIAPGFPSCETAERGKRQECEQNLTAQPSVH
jgi:hypothetical protein